MPAPSALDQHGFRRILLRNIALPLGVGVVSAIVFVALILYLLSAMNWVDHSEQVIGDANELQRLIVEQETGVRGYLLTGDESFLQPYEVARPKFASELASLSDLVSDNLPQVARLRRIQALELQWDRYAVELINLRRHNQPFDTIVSSGRGKAELDAIRTEFADFMA